VLARDVETDVVEGNQHRAVLFNLIELVFDYMLQLFSKKTKTPGLVGISVSSEKLSIAHMDERNGNPYLLHCESNALASQKDAAETLAKRVKALGIERLPASFVLSRRDYALHLIEAPNVEPEEMRAAARWKIKDLLDMKVEEAVIDVFQVPEDAYRGRQGMMYVVAAVNPRVKAIIDMVVNCGLELKVIDIPEMVMKNFSTYMLNDENGLAFMDLRKTGSTINLTRNGDLYLTRRINTQVAADVMRSAEWESLKDRLVLEIQRSLDYYESQMGQQQIANIVLAPRISDTKAMLEALNQALNVKVTALEMKGNLDSKIDLTPELQQSCMAAIGATLRNRAPLQRAQAA
jgi:MSHA biogenesis protein MshI